ncbi:DUF2334 domain-containing protein [Pelagicoccus mobilis]|uniref:Polysaccharide deacetylase family protein n=1 Tax=Pelagicoccus mobilis TaxID=415221 RepID=A0A934VMN8_9BACT|nr:DUF2334 domain-containing protein [Pelagicoccus mobilis]MBK1875377.1 polysaccharide deacetylase family protein [Pelagicoccus mobilis]
MKIKGLLGVLLFVACLWGDVAIAEDGVRKIAIVKADDVRGVSNKWDAFFAVSKELGIRVSAGVICNSLEAEGEGYHEWLKGYQSSGYVEFWNHGWDHQRWESENGDRLSEFGGSGYAHQKRHFEDSQAMMARVLGVPSIAFGSPYNAFDADTERVLSENEDVRLLFSYRLEGKAGKAILPMRFKGELDGTGKPNFEAFKSEYASKKRDVTLTALQFHPLYFEDGGLEEYAKIVEFMLAEGWVFVLPSEFLAMTE